MLPFGRRPPRGYWLLSHRGARFDAPANTIAAFDLALQKGADGVELDIRRTSDGHWVSIHDKTAVVQGRRRQVATIARDKLAHEVCDLQAVAAWLTTRPNAVVNIEVKQPDHVAEILPIVAGHLGQIVFTSFVPDAVWRLTQEEPEAVTGLLTTYGGSFLVEVARLAGCRLIVWRDRAATPQLLERAQAAGLYSWIWDSRSRTRVRSWAHLGTNGFIVDRVERLLA